MTNEQIKCPVCDKEMMPDPWNSEMYMHSIPERGRICPFKYESKTNLDNYATLIQSRIDKAVIAERERVDKIKARLDICLDKNYWVNSQGGADYPEGFREGYLHAVKDIRDAT